MRGKRPDGDWVCEHSPGRQWRSTTLSKAIARLYEAADVDTTGGTWHRFRHSYASQLAEAGVGVEDLRALLGHSSLRVTEKYLHSSQRGRRRAVDALELGP